MHKSRLAMNDSASSDQPVNREGWWTRDHALVIVLVAATALLLILCWQLVQPFMGPIAWAFALAVVAHPLHGWIACRIDKPGLAASLAVFTIAVVIVAPAIFVGNSIVREAATGVKGIQSGLQDGKWREQLARSPRLGGALSAIEQQVNLGSQLQGMSAEVGKRISQVVTGSAWAVVELLLTLFVIFYLFRDRRKALATLRSLVPLSERETDEVFSRVSDTIHATIYGTLVVAAEVAWIKGANGWNIKKPARAQD